MQSLVKGRKLTSPLIVLQIFLQLSLVLPGPALAQVLDTSPPVIDFRAVEEGYKGDSQVFSVTVTDDRAVAAVILHYRLDSESTYQTRRMGVLGTTSIYTTTVSIAESVDSIQYYIEATDVVGNRTLQGFAFDPLQRQLVERQAAVAETSQADSPSGLSTRTKVLYGILGLVVVGALASAAGGGGSDSEAPGVDVTIVVEPLP